MSYLINKTNGQLILTLLDGTADGPSINPGLNTLDINLFGKNYPTYGEFQNENFVKLLENFANSTPPTSPVRGELWYDTTNNLLKVFATTTWRPVSPMIVSATEPTTAGTTIVIGTQWWDTTNDQVFAYTGTSWVLIGPPYSKIDGKSGAFPDNIYDTLGGKHTVVKIYTNGNVSSIASYDMTFIPNVAISGFANISTGWNVNTAIGAQFVGTTTNALSLGDVLAQNYARTDIDESFNGNVSIASNKLQINAAPTSDINITNTTSGASTNFYVNVAGLLTRAVYVNGVTGTLQVSSTPSSNYDVTNKSYVDASIATAIAPLAPLDSPSLVGIPIAPTAAFGANTAQIATTQFTQIAINPLAPLASPGLTGIPTAPTAGPGTSTLQIASTEFVTTAIENQRFRYTVSTEVPSSSYGDPTITDGHFWFRIQGL
jgi:hypothetical protein